ncbi:Receptor-like protein kinase FERONIA [Sesamum alatum]|uniref:non-specific serine/threonine protein kinase n=1 Tax=Sesamum alatum TaxID=300844 RepID=A0AAE1XTB1_9LAMI|nr:Receptor-like protein kinase FERONIA [Sesamum alatum]
MKSDKFDWNTVAAATNQFSSSQLNKDAPDDYLFILEVEKLSIEDALKMEWSALNSKIRRSMRAMKVFVRVYLASEKLLMDQIFGELESVNSVLADVIPDIAALYSDEAESCVRNECQDILKTLGDCAKATFLEFQNAVASNVSADAFPDGGVLPLTRYVMNYIKTLMDYSKTLDEVVKDQDNESSPSVSPNMSPISEDENVGESPSSSPLALRFRSLISILESNLDEKSKLYKDESLQHLFLMNNIHYMAEKVKNSELRTVLGDEWIRKHNWKFQQHAMNYERATWSSILALLKDEGIQNPGSNSISRTILKERLQSFYLAFEEVYKSQTGWSVPDSQLRDDLRISTSLRVIRAYLYFSRRYSYRVDEKHVKYTADDLEVALKCLADSLLRNENIPTHFTGDVSINCGSIGTYTTARNGREWIGDDVKPKKLSSLLQMDGSSTTSTVIHKLISADPVPHKTARISLSHFSYTFQVSPGQKILRLHFYPAPYKGFKRFKDLFTVEAGPFTLISNFSASLTAAALGVKSFSKEFCISIEENQTLDITFSPASSQSQDSTYAFINGIEIISVPMHLSYFRGDDFDDMLGMWAIVPAQNGNEFNNLTWKKSVDVGFRYLVRIHFCELGLKMAETGGMSFKILINQMIVDTNTVIVKERDDHGSLWYRDYMVEMKGRKQESRRDLLICLQSYDEFMDGHRLLKGFEIFKLSNPDNSLASPNALPPARDSPSWIIQYFLSFLGNRNAIATASITVIALINIIVYKLRIIWEASTTEEENRPSARAERVCRRFSLAEIKSATRNFSDAFVIGKGGFGKVYKGLIDNGRETVAIKRLKSNSKQGKHKFLTEIETLSELQHINLVSLIGYCSERTEMILVYEYMACGTLADHLYKLAKDNHSCSSITWKQRLSICIGAARGLDYLHTGHRVIHRDIKTSNILLDENFEAKVSDFGLAKPEDRSKLQSHVSTKIKGTFGYFDPYYFSTHKLTRQSDTYAFGVVLLEVLCGRPAMDPTLGEDECCLTKWARNKINKGEIQQIIASSLIEEISPDSLKVFLEVAERCLHDEPKERPTMAKVVLQLELALEKQQSRKFVAPETITSAANDARPSNEGTISSVSTEQAKVASTDTHTVGPPPIGGINGETDNTDPPAGRKDGRKPKAYESLQRWARQVAFWNRVKPSKKEEFVCKSVSEICEAEIKLPKFDLERIAAATNQFSSSNKIGQGGFGSVYKAMLPTGQIVAVKMFSFSTQGLNEFKHEIRLVSNLQHRNIVKLLGYCIHGEGGMLLYEFMENGRLDTFIFDEVQCHQLQWSLRFKIILGFARGVLYLHEGKRLRIVHRDLKPNNILLDTEMNPRIPGFGIAKTLGDDQSDAETRLAGTLGYIPQEYAFEGRLSEKLDVYRFGVVVLEILSGKKNMRYPRYDLNLIAFAWELWSEGRALDLIDESVGGAFPAEEALRCIHVSLLCTQQQPHLRPTMRSVIVLLLDTGFSLQEKVAKAASYRGNVERTGALNLENEYPESSFIASQMSEINEHNGIPDSGCDTAATFEYDNKISEVVIRRTGPFYSC